MIRNHQQLAVTQQRVADFLALLAQLRRTCTPEELAAVSSGYRAEVEHMQRDVLDYLTRHATEPAAGIG
jgi:hypothetical protein